VDCHQRTLSAPDDTDLPETVALAPRASARLEAMPPPNDPAGAPDTGPSAAAAPDRLVVAVTGPTGTFGFGLMPLLEA
jgi:hypothetical protein